MFHRVLTTLLMTAVSASAANVGLPPLLSDETSDIDAGIGARSGSMANGFVVTWLGTEPSEDGMHGIYAQGYSNSGTRIGHRTLLCTQKQLRSHPVICGSHHSDKFFVAYQLADGIHFTEGMLTEEGIVTLISDCPTHANKYHENHHHFHMSLACRTDGGLFALAYSEFNDKQTNGVKLMLWNSNTFDHYEPPEPIDVSPVRKNIQCNPDVAILENGNIVVVWQDIHLYSINGQLFEVSGVHIGVPFLVTSMVGFESNPTVEAFNTNAGFLVGWKDTSGMEFPMVVGGRIYYPTTYVQVFNDAAQKVSAHWKIKSNDASGNILSMAVTESDSIWVSWIEGTNLHGCKYSLSGDVQAPGCFEMESTVYRGYNSMRLGMSPLLGEGFVLTTGRGKLDPVATFWYSDSQPQQNETLPCSHEDEAAKNNKGGRRKRNNGKRNNRNS